MDAADLIASVVHQTDYVDLPTDVVEATIKDIIDTIGTILAGSSAEGCREVIDLVSNWQGKPQSTVLLADIKVPAPLAAFVNSMMGHARDLDDTHDEAVVHAGISVVPAALAVAEEMGGVSGKEFITAVSLGVDLICRLGLATLVGPNESGWALTSIYSYFGAAVAAAKLLRLDAAKIRNALGIAYSQVAGNVQAVHDAALTKRMQPAFGAKAGVLSAYLAARGITGAKEVFEGKFGLFNVYHRGSFDRRQLVSDLGSRFEVVNLSLKPYPCCRFTHTSIDATLDLVNQFDLKPNEVQDVKVSVTRQANIVCEPEETRKRPKTVVDAQFSIPYTVANAIVKRKVFIEDFSEVELKNEEVLSLAQRVITRYDDEMYQEWGRGITPAIVEIYLKSGESLSKRVDYPKGHPVNPLSDSDLVDKFKRCADHACKVLSPQVLDEAIDMLLELNNMENICDFLQHF